MIELKKGFVPYSNGYNVLVNQFEAGVQGTGSMTYAKNLLKQKFPLKTVSAKKGSFPTNNQWVRADKLTLSGAPIMEFNHFTG